MKETFRFLLRMIGLPFTFLITFSVELGKLFTMSLLIACFGGWILDIQGALLYLPVAWKIYFAVSLFTLAILKTEKHRVDLFCIILEREAPPRTRWHNMIDIVASLFWPATWIMLDKLRKYRGGFKAVLFNNMGYWIRVVRIRCYRFAQGIRTRRARRKR